MSVYVYRRDPSVGAHELAEAIEGTRYRALRQPIEQKARRGDVIICWGESLPSIQGVQILNGAPLTNKFTDAQRLRQAGVPTIEVSRTRPMVAPTVDPAQPLFNQARELAGEFYDVTYARSDVFRRGLGDLASAIQNLRSAMERPLPPGQLNGLWIARLNNHVGGNDLLNPPTAADFFVKKEEIRDEIRIHSFRGKSIRAGKKVIREGVNPHSWIRSFDGGWRINYDGFKSKKAQRELAHQAVEALGLQFGAVDIGIKTDGSLIVLEVNRAPGLEGGTVEAYARAIEGWLEGENQ